ncbi:hypothetical protein, partial [Enterococcus faecium]|uniref:hypothetical protein n=1 Tax=Enterococcus faecium TaxID=1352 RepID=UPI0034DB778B
DQEELIHLISNYSKISLYQHHLTKSLKKQLAGDCSKSRILAFQTVAVRSTVSLRTIYGLRN